MQLTNLVNCTPHAIVLHSRCGCEGCSGDMVMHGGWDPTCDGVQMITIPASGVVARVATTPGIETKVYGVPVPVMTAAVVGEVQNLPEPQEGVMFVVSGMVLAALRGSRPDVVGPGTGPNDGAVRDASGRIVAVTRLVR